MSEEKKGKLILLSGYAFQDGLGQVYLRRTDNENSCVYLTTSDIRFFGIDALGIKDFNEERFLEFYGLEEYEKED